MKTNAIIRICIYTVLILFLVGILAVVLMGWNPFHGDGYTWEISDGQFTKVYEATIALEEPETWPIDDSDLFNPTDKAFAKADGEVYTVTSQLNYRTSPSNTATVLGHLRPGDIIKIDQVENVDGVEWGHVTTTTTQSWVCMDYVEPAAENAFTETWPIDDVDLFNPNDKAFSRADGEVYTVASQLNYRTSPSKTSAVLGHLDPGDIIKIDQVENVDGAEWGHVTTTSTQSWVCMDYVEPAAENVIDKPAADNISATTATEDFGPPIVGGTNIPAGQITKLSIDWAVGDVVLRRGNTQSINISEDAPDGAKPMVVKVKDGHKLDIKFWEGKFTVNLGFGNMDSKDLTITVPMDFDLRELEIDMASGNVRLEALTIDEIDFDCADVECVIENCTVGSMDVDTASGDITFSGSLNELDLDSASADFVGVFTNTPRSINMDGMSGSLDITLPEDLGFSAKVDGMSCSFNSDYPTRTVNGAYTYGDGYCRIDVDGMSEELIIRRAAN